MNTLEHIKYGAWFALEHPNAPYEFERDDLNGQACENLSAQMFEQMGCRIERCPKKELNKDFIGNTPSGTPFELEVKGDYKSIIFGNFFIECQNSKWNKPSGIMCGNSECLWHHYFFTPNDYTKVHLLHTTKGFLRELITTHCNDTAHFQPKSIPNARGYTVTQLFFIEHIPAHMPQYLNSYKILTYNLLDIQKNTLSLHSK